MCSPGGLVHVQRRGSLCPLAQLQGVEGAVKEMESQRHARCIPGDSQKPVEDSKLQSGLELAREIRGGRDRKVSWQWEISLHARIISTSKKMWPSGVHYVISVTSGRDAL